MDASSVFIKAESTPNINMAGIEKVGQHELFIHILWNLTLPSPWNIKTTSETTTIFGVCQNYIFSLILASEIRPPQKLRPVYERVP